MVCPTIGNKSDRGASGSGQKPDPTRSTDGGKTAKTEEQEVVAVDARSITDSICRGRHGAQYGRDNYNIRICVAVSGGGEASLIRRDHVLGTISADSHNYSRCELLRAYRRGASRGRASPFESRTDKVAISPDQSTLAHRAKIVE